MSRNPERGGARLKAIVWTAVLVSLFYAGFKIIPAYVANYQLQDKLTIEARYATVNHRSDEDLRNIIFREMQDRGLDSYARREDIKILENGQRGVRISVDYTVPVDLKVYQLNLHFNPSADNRSLY